MITKRNGNGQTECVGCKDKGKNMPLTWDSWLYNFNDKPYCQECLFEMLEEYQQRIDKTCKFIIEEYYKEHDKPIENLCLENCTYEPSLVALSILKGKEVNE